MTMLGATSGIAEAFSFDLSQLYQGLIAPLLHPLQPASRLFWVFWVSSAALVIITLYAQHDKQRGNFSGRLIKALFSARYWLTRSTLTDLSYLFGNSILRILLIIPLFGSHLAATLIVARALQANFGNAPVIELAWLSIALIYTLVFFVLEDLSRFLLHLCMHRVPVLWRLHRVHHSALRLTPLTLFRVHPLEMLLYYLRGLVVFGCVSGVFVYLFGRKLSGLDILGVDALGFAFNFFGANLRHSHIWLSFGRLEKWFISPAQHQIHHSSAPAHRDKNFGTSLAIWDRVFGSHIPAASVRRRLRFGVI